MRVFFAVLLVYALFLIQAGLPQGSPDLVLVAVIIFALHEHKLTSALLGVFAGLCLDLVTPPLLGSNMVALTLLAYIVSSLRGVLYRARWYTVLLTLLGLALRWSSAGLFGPGLPDAAALLLPAGVTLALSPLIDLLLTRLFYPRWTPA